MRGLGSWGLAAPVVVGGLVAGLAEPGSVLRLVSALACCLVLPGLGWARKLRLNDAGDTLALTLVLSICATVVAATAMAVSGRWSTLGGLIFLSGVALLGFVPMGRRAGRTSPVGALAGSGQLSRESTGSVSWTDWYAMEEDASAARQAERQAAADQATAQWVDWYEKSRRGGR